MNIETGSEGEVRRQVREARTRVPTAALLACALLALVLGALGGSGAVAAGTSSWTDPAGDAGQAADAVTVTIANDDAGLLTFKLVFGNRSGGLGDEGISLFLDADRSTATPGGTCAGTDFRLRYFGLSFPKFALDTCGASGFTENVPAPTFAGAFDPATQTLTFTINRSDLATTAAFNFWIFAAKTGTPDQELVPDDAASGNRLTYTLQFTPPPPPPPPPDTQPPAAPTQLTAALQAGPQVALSWAASTDNVGVTAYRVYRNGAELGTATGTSYTDASPPVGATLTYEVRALDAAGNVSPPSAFASVTTPAPPPPNSDGDALADPSDRCPTVSGGRYDTNANGCPGPFKRLVFDDVVELGLTGGRKPRLLVRYFGLTRLEAKTIVTLSSARGRETVVSRGRSVYSRKLRGQALGLDTTIVIRATKPGFIGFDLRYHLRTGRVSSHRCVPPTGSQKPVACKRVSRGS